LGRAEKFRGTALFSIIKAGGAEYNSFFRRT
jgi:hypothetical protein